MYCGFISFMQSICWLTKYYSGREFILSFFAHLIKKIWTARYHSFADSWILSFENNYKCLFGVRVYLRLTGFVIHCCKKWLLNGQELTRQTLWKAFYAYFPLRSIDRENHVGTSCEYVHFNYTDTSHLLHVTTCICISRLFHRYFLWPRA